MKDEKDAETINMEKALKEDKSTCMIEKEDSKKEDK